MDHFEEIVYYAFINFSIHSSLHAENFINTASVHCSTDEDYTHYLHKVHQILYIACADNEKADYADWIGYPNKQAVIEWLHC